MLTQWKFRSSLSNFALHHLRAYRAAARVRHLSSAENNARRSVLCAVLLNSRESGPNLYDDKYRPKSIPALDIIYDHETSHKHIDKHVFNANLGTS